MSTEAHTPLDLPREELEDRLRLWGSTHDLHVRAAVDLLIDTDTWLRRRDFIEHAVRIPEFDPNLATIRWVDARAWLDQGVVGSSTEIAILDFAIRLARNEFRWSSMGPDSREKLLRAVQTVLGGGA